MSCFIYSSLIHRSILCGVCVRACAFVWSSYILFAYCILSFLFSVLAFISRCIHLIGNLLYFSVNKDNVLVLLFLFSFT